VVTIGDQDHPWLRGYINERDHGRVKLGTKAKITGDSFPGEMWGQRIVHRVASRVHTQANPDERERVKLVYRIKIDVDNPRHVLKSNMPVDAELVLD